MGLAGLLLLVVAAVVVVVVVAVVAAVCACVCVRESAYKARAIASTCVRNAECCMGHDGVLLDLSVCVCACGGWHMCVCGG